MTYILYNPLSKNKAGIKLINKLNVKKAINTTSLEEMNFLEKKLKNNDEIIILGGDGTLHYLINNYHFILEYQLYLYPNGSGNDFYRGLSNDTAFYYNVADHQFINSFGIGIDALICEKVNKLSTKNKFSYLTQAYSSILNYKPIDIDITINNETRSYQNVWLCSLQNTPYFGGNIKIAHQAKHEDKMITFCLAHNINRFTLIYLLLFLKLGLAKHLKNVLTIRDVNDISFKSKQPFLAQLDGDTLYLNNDLEVKAGDIIKIKKIKKHELLNYIN